MQNVYEFKLGREKMLLHMNDKLFLFKNGWDTNRHNNSEFELHIILHGSCRLDVENSHLHLKESDAVIIAPGRFHAPTIDQGAFERFSVSFTLSQGQLLSSLTEQVSDCWAFSVSQEILSLCRTILCECAIDNPYQHELLQACLVLLMITVLRPVCCLPLPRKDAVCSDEDIRGELIDTFFEHHLADGQANENELASELHLSRRQLYRVLQDLYGMGFRKKLIHTRMDRAAWLLRTSEQPLSVVGREVGYTSEAGFFQAFRNRFGVTPLQYRTKYKKEVSEE